MPRALDTSLKTALAAGLIVPCILAAVTFKTDTQYVWTGIGPLVYNAQTYSGLGSLVSIGAVNEGTEVKADGTTIGLSGIDPTLYAECENDIQAGAPAKIYFALLSQGVVIGAPYLIFSGVVDKPTSSDGPDSINVSLALENKLTNLQRASQRRYTSADQHSTYPDDTGFVWVEILSDQALVWGT